MRSFLFSLRRVALVALLGASVASGAACAESLRVMTFNVRVPVAQDGPNAWPHRRDLLVEVIARAKPDVIGTQELVKGQGDYLIARLPEYAWFGSGRRGGHRDEHMGIFYRRDRLRLVELGDFWLSDTPKVPGSISWGHPYPRMVTWGLFEAIGSGRRFYVYNTHFPYRAEDEAARSKAAAAIAARLELLPRDIPVVLTGDFNTEPDKPAYAILGRLLSDARTTAAETKGPDGTFHGFGGNAERRIDWIFARGLRATRSETDTSARSGRYPSDHFPVTVDFAW